MRFARTNLGLIPAWQFSQDPAINPKINPTVKYPAGVYQTTPQPLYPYYQGPNLNGGLGAVTMTEIGVGLGLLGVLAVAAHLVFGGKKRRRRR